MFPAKLPSHWGKGQPWRCVAQAPGTDLRLSGLAANTLPTESSYGFSNTFLLSCKLGGGLLVKEAEGIVHP